MYWVTCLGLHVLGYMSWVTCLGLHVLDYVSWVTRPGPNRTCNKYLFGVDADIIEGFNNNSNQRFRPVASGRGVRDIADRPRVRLLLLLLLNITLS